MSPPRSGFSRRPGPRATFASRPPALDPPHAYMTSRTPHLVALIGIAFASVGPTAAVAQDRPYHFELRLGAVYSGILADGEVLPLAAQGTDSRETVEVQPGVAPGGDAAFAFAFSPMVDGEVRLGVSSGGLTGRGPSGTWHAGSVTAITAVAGLGVHLWPRFVLRGALGKLFHSSDAAVMDGGTSTGLLLVGGIGYELPVDLSFGLRLDGDLQWHSFGSPALREAGAADASAYRISIMAAATFGGTR